MLITMLGVVYMHEGNRKKNDGVSCQIPELTFIKHLVCARYNARLMDYMKSHLVLIIIVWSRFLSSFWREENRSKQYKITCTVFRSQRVGIGRKCAKDIFYKYIIPDLIIQNLQIVGPGDSVLVKNCGVKWWNKDLNLEIKQDTQVYRILRIMQVSM